MRKSVFDVQWLKAEDGTLQGLCLGYDRCAEHEWGVSALEAYLGVPQPEFRVGPTDRVIHNPGNLRLIKYSRKPSDKRRKAYPAMLLVCERPRLWQGLTPDNYPGVLYPEVNFNNVDPGSDAHRPRYDLDTAWGTDSFAVHARGSENISNLQEVYDAAQRGDLALAAPGSRWLSHGLSLVIVSRLTPQEVARITENDESYRELQLAARASGIESTLKAAGKKWFALSPSWEGAQKSALKFFLNPQDQKTNASGWFTVEELQQWAQDAGPVVACGRAQELEYTPEGRKTLEEVGNLLANQGLLCKRFPRLAWLDPQKTIKGVHLQMTPDSEVMLPSGLYPLTELFSRFAGGSAKAPNA